MDKKDLEQRIIMIQELMEESTRKVMSGGYYFILFSLFSIIGTVVSYIMVHFNLEDSVFLFWLIYWPVISVLTIFFSRGKAVQGEKKNILSSLTGIVWMALVVVWGVVLVSSYIIMKKWSFSFSFSLLSYLLGFGFFFNGFTIKHGLILKILAFIWVMAGFSLLLVRNEYTIPLFFAGYQFLFQFIPGIIIYNKYKKSV